MEVWWWLQHNLSHVALPPAFFTWVLSNFFGHQGAAVNALCTLAAFGAAWANLFLYEQGRVDDPYGLGVAVQVGLCVFAVRPLGSTSVARQAAVGGSVAANLVLGTAAGALVFVSISHGMVREAALLASALYVALTFQRLACPRGWSPVLVWGAGFAVGLAASESTFRFVFPVREVELCLETMGELVRDRRELQDRTVRLFLMAVNCQVPLGLVGIGYLRQYQARKMALNDVGKTVTRSQFFGRVRRFFFAVAVPYMLQRIAMETLNTHHLGLYKAFVEEEFRVELLFRGGGTANLGVAAASNLTVGAHSDSLMAVVDKHYGIVERKLFALPKILLFPGILISDPALGVTVLPVSVTLDLVKSMGIARLTGRIESLNDEARTLASRRDRIEAHDTRNEALITSYDAAAFTRSRWRDTTRQLQLLSLEVNALSSLRSFVGWLYWSNILVTGIECMLAQLISKDLVDAVDIWVYTRVVEDTLDLVLTKSKSEAEIASAMTHRQRLADLAGRLRNETATASPPRPHNGATAHHPMHRHASVTNTTTTTAVMAGSEPNESSGSILCEVDPKSDTLRISRLSFARGRTPRGEATDQAGATRQRPGTETATMASFGEELSLRRGTVYAVTGPNGSGKSTLFSLLRGCGAVPFPPQLHRSIRILSPSIASSVHHHLESEETGSGGAAGRGGEGQQSHAAQASITLPSTAVEMTQRFYCPLYTTPMAWLSQPFGQQSGHQRSRGGNATGQVAVPSEAKILALAVELSLFPPRGTTAAAPASTDLGVAAVDGESTAVRGLGRAGGEEALKEAEDRLGLHRERENWYSELSGGQVAKVEFMRSVFLRSECPGVLLIDEAFGPLDPASKAMVQHKIRTHCEHSVVLVVYHADANPRGPPVKEGGGDGGAGHGTVAMEDGVDLGAEVTSGGAPPRAAGNNTGADHNNTHGRHRGVGDGNVGAGCVEAGSFFDAELRFEGPQGQGRVSLWPTCQQGVVSSSSSSRASDSRSGTQPRELR